MWHISGYLVKMQRGQAVSKASKFLGRKHDIKTGSTAKTIKDRANNNGDLNRARLNQIVADIYQRGVDPKDLDLEKIDWSVSYQNIRGQVKDLLDKRGADAFDATKRRKRNSDMDYAEKKASEQLMTVAEVRDERRDNFNQFIDRTKTAETTFGRLTDSAFQKWSRNPNKYDIEGVDTRDEEELRGMQVGLPFQKKSSDRIKEMRLSNAEQDSGSNERLGMSGSAYATVFQEDIGVEGSDELVDEASDAGNRDIGLSDSRKMTDVSKNIGGTTSERSSQESLRDGYASKSSEKTLGNWDEFE